MKKNFKPYKICLKNGLIGIFGDRTQRRYPIWQIKDDPSKNPHLGFW